MNKWERLEAAVRGKPVDRPPVSAWRHFVDKEWGASEHAQAMLEFQRTYDWDFMKVNPRATCFAEAFGNRYDPQRYEGVRPALVEPVVKSTRDLGRIRPVDAGAGAFAEQIEALGKIRGGLDGEVPFIQTVFSPLSVVGLIAGGELASLRRFIAEDPGALEAATQAVAASLVAYARACLEAGASGIFFAIVRLAREGALTREEYARFGRPYDLQVLEAVRPHPTGAQPDFKLNILHVCGDGVYFPDVHDYPVQAINWNSRGPGNPSLAQAQAYTLAAVAGGVAQDGAIRRGTPSEVAAEVESAIASTGGHRMFVTPGCTVDPSTPAENLRALREAVDRAKTR